MTGALPYSLHETRTSRMVVWGGGTLLGVLAAEVVLGSYNAGLTSFKPALFTFAVFVACAGIALVNRPRFAPAALLVLLLPMVRLFDAVVLARADSSYVEQTGMDHLRVMLELLAVLAVLATDQGQRAVLWAAMLAIVLTTGSEIAEMLGLAKFTSISGRFSGFNGHPNFPPILLCEMLGIVFALSKNFRLNCVFIGICVVGVALTYGRAGMVVLVMMAAPYVLFNARRNLPFLLLIALLAVPALGIGFAVLQSRTHQGVMKDKNTSERLQAIYELDFEKLKSPERAKDLSDAWEGVMQKPLLGHGTGVSGSRWAPHNEYVSIWLEMGIPGLLLFVGTLGVLVVRSVMTGGTAGYLLFAIIAFTPAGQGRLETPHYCLALATAAHLLWKERYRIRLR